tara:strand:+ start:142240 stop:143742 length:1503 start_codon:yes stop_codon:yes gene_type:complete
MQFSHFLVSLTTMILSLNYLLEGKYISKLHSISKRLPVMMFFGLFLLHVVGLFWSTDLAYGGHDVQIKLPILALPIILGSSAKLTVKQFEWVLVFFIATSLVSSIVGSVIYFVLSQPGDDYRLMSPFMSHIRLSLMMGVAVFSSFYLSQRSTQFQQFSGWLRGLGFWFIIYLFMLRAMSGIVAVLAASLVLVWALTSNYRVKYSRWIKTGIIVFTVLTIGYVYYQVQEFYDIEELSLNTVDKHTKSGEEYTFDLDKKTFENGHYTYSYIAINELRTEWNKESKLDFDGADLKGQSLQSTLIRYLTSKNLRKDKEGVAALTHLDVWAVENGIANERFLNEKSLNTMIYRYIWEVHNYSQGFNPQGNSLAQRFLFWKNGVEILKENWLYGVGTGDVQLAYNEQYDKMPYEIMGKYRLRAHNQFLTMGVTFGIFGLIYFLCTMFSGFWLTKNAKSYLFLGSFIILMVSMLDEDTLETQFGVTYAMFFYFLFLFHQPVSEEVVD